jgi:hypothetical protein
MATCSDDSDIDLRIWVTPGETAQEEAARQVLRHFAMRWWAQNLKHEAHQWLEESDHSPADREAVRDVLTWAKATQYFKWVCGSRIFF